jgi:hypothetical protein
MHICGDKKTQSYADFEITFPPFIAGTKLSLNLQSQMYVERIPDYRNPASSGASKIARFSRGVNSVVQIRIIFLRLICYWPTVAYVKRT